MGSHPRPQYFISRPDHTITPLIAVDELPNYIRIDGVSPAMSQADTHAMTSMGVKERSLGRYDVHLVKTSGSSCSSSSEEPAKQASWSGIDASSTASGSDAKAPVAGKQTEHIDEATADSGSVEVIQRPDLTNVEEKTAIVTKEANEEVEAPKSSHVEEWRQKVDVDETQAKIDALLAASAQGNDKAKEKVGDEDPRAARQKLGLTPGKKVYCSHWIRTGECDFIQQGCIYKHEMPDDDSLHAIGIRAVPAWYIAAHPEKARERGIGRGMASGSRSWGARGGPFPASSFTSSRAPLRSQPPAFHSQSTYGFPSKPDATFFGPPAGFSPNFARPSFASHTDQFPGYGHGRIQELPDQAPQQYQYSPRSHSTELQIMRKPAKPKTPGFNTFPFQLPPPTAAASSAPEKHQTKPAPVWEPRPSKLAHRLAYRTDHVPTTTSAENGVAAPRTEHATQQSNQDQANLLAPSSAGGGPHLSNDIKAPRDLSLPNTILHNSTSAAPSTSRPLAINTAYPSLQPIAHPQPTPAAIPARDRKESDSSDLFALVPKTPSPPHRRLFVAPGEERYVTAAEEPKAVREEATVVKEKAGTSPPQDKTPKRHRKDRVASRNERPKNLLYSDSKKRVVSPEKTRKGKQVVKEPRQSIEPLVAL